MIRVRKPGLYFFASTDLSCCTELVFSALDRSRPTLGTGINRSERITPVFTEPCLRPKDGDAMINASGKYKVKGLALVSVG